MSSCVLIRAFDVPRLHGPAHSSATMTTALGSIAFEMEPRTARTRCNLEAPSHQRGDARGQLNEPVHTLYTIQLTTTRGSACRQRIRRHPPNRIDAARSLRKTSESRKLPRFSSSENYRGLRRKKLVDQCRDPLMMR